MLMLFRDSGDNYQNVVHVTEYTNTGLIEGNIMHKEASHLILAHANSKPRVR